MTNSRAKRSLFLQKKHIKIGWILFWKLQNGAVNTIKVYFVHMEKYASNLYSMQNKIVKNEFGWQMKNKIINENKCFFVSVWKIKHAKFTRKKINSLDNNNPFGKTCFQRYWTSYRKGFNQIQAWIMRTFFYTGYLFSVKVHFAPMHLNKPKCCLCFILCGRWLVFVSTEFVSLAIHLANMICIWEINKKFHAFSLVSISEFDIFSNNVNNILFILLKDQQINVERPTNKSMHRCTA